MDGIALLHDVEDAQRVDGHDLDAAVRLLVEGRGEVGRDSGHVEFALDELRHDLIGSAVELQVIVEGSSAVLLHAQQVDEAHGGGAFQAGDAHFCARLGRCAAGQHADHQHQRQQ